MAPSICIVDVDCNLDPADVTGIADALNRQVIEHFAPAWGVLASVRAGQPQPNEWVLQLLKVPTIDAALGFHDETSEGQPLLYVFPELCAEAGVSWSSCASHEILEALADPYLRRCVQDESTGAIYAQEICDACEALSYSIDGVEVSDFCTPAWSEPPRNLAGVKFDYLGRCPEPFSVLPGGYSQTWEPGQGWVQRGAQRAYRTRIRDMGLGRGIRRKAIGVIA